MAETHFLKNPADAIDYVKDKVTYRLSSLCSTVRILICFLPSMRSLDIITDYLLIMAGKPHERGSSDPAVEYIILHM
jgi:hypothetical protein